MKFPKTRECSGGYRIQSRTLYFVFSSCSSLLFGVLCFFATAGVVEGNERFAPLLPAQFDCKARVDIAYTSSSGADAAHAHGGSRSSKNQQPMLLLLHADLDSGRVREDYYLLPEGNAGGGGGGGGGGSGSGSRSGGGIPSNSSPEKVYTIVRRFDEGRQYMAYYRVEGWKGHVPTPRACFITAVEGELPQRDFLRQSASYIDTLHFNLAINNHRGGIAAAVVLTPQGETSTTATKVQEQEEEVEKGRDDRSGGVNHTVFANVWRFELGGKLMQLIESTRTRLPVQLQMVGGWVGE